MWSSYKQWFGVLPISSSVQLSADTISYILQYKFLNMTVVCHVSVGEHKSKAADV